MLLQPLQPCSYDCYPLFYKCVRLFCLFIFFHMQWFRLFSSAMRSRLCDTHTHSISLYFYFLCYFVSVLLFCFLFFFFFWETLVWCMAVRCWFFCFVPFSYAVSFSFFGFFEDFFTKDIDKQKICTCICCCIYMYIYRCICVYACTYVCMYVCMYVCIYLCMCDCLLKGRHVWQQERDRMK